MAFTNLPDFLTVAQTANELRCHPDTVTALIRCGKLKAVRLGRAIRVVSESISALASGNDHSDSAGVGGTHVNHA